MEKLNVQKILNNSKPMNLIETRDCQLCKTAQALDGEDFCDYCNRFYGIKVNVPSGYLNMTLENFKVLSPGHQTALEQAVMFIGHNQPGIFLYGDVGVGKTHLMMATLIHGLSLSQYCRYYNVSEMLHIKRDEYETQEEAETRLLEKLLLPKFLFLDDLFAEKASEKTRAFLYLLFNKILEIGKPKIFITSNAPLSMISASLDDRIASRIAGIVGKNGVIKLTGKDQRVR